MKKYVKTDKLLVTACIGLFVFLAAGIAALCCLNCALSVGALSLSALLGIISAVAFAVYLCVVVVTAATKKTARYLVLSAEIIVVSTVLTALLPITLLAWVVESSVEAISEKRTKNG